MGAVGVVGMALVLVVVAVVGHSARRRRRHCRSCRRNRHPPPHCGPQSRRPFLDTSSQALGRQPVVRRRRPRCSGNGLFVEVVNKKQLQQM